MVEVVPWNDGCAVLLNRVKTLHAFELGHLILGDDRALVAGFFQILKFCGGPLDRRSPAQPSNPRTGAW